MSAQRHQVGEKHLRAGPPAEPLRVRAAGVTLACQRRQRRTAQIGVDRTHLAQSADQYVTRAAHVIGCDRGAAGERFQQHQSERVGA